MIKDVTGDILCARTEALVNPVNCVGVMGKGLAAQFKRRFPHAFDLYASACAISAIRLGLVTIYDAGNCYVVNFPTKGHWRDKSKISDIECGLLDLRAVVCSCEIRSIAIPALGCGLGGLKWDVVRAAIVDVFLHEDVDVHLYGPEGH